MSFRSCLANELVGGKRNKEYAEPKRTFVARGCFGVVYKCTKEERVFAEKVVRCRPNGEEKEILREFDAMCLAWRASEEFFLRPLFLEINKEGEEAVIGMEWFDGEPLQNVKNREMAEKKLYWAAKALNTVGVFHEDLQPQNVLISPDRKRLKVIDFGSVTMFEEEKVVFDPADYIAGSEEDPKELDEKDARVYQLFEFFRLFATRENMKMFIQGNKKWTEILELFDEKNLEEMLE